MRIRILKNMYPTNIKGLYDINQLSGEIFDIISNDIYGNITIYLNSEELTLYKGEYEVLSVRDDLEHYMRKYPLEYNLCGGSNFVSFIMNHRKDLVDILS